MDIHCPLQSNMKITTETEWILGRLTLLTYLRVLRKFGAEGRWLYDARKINKVPFFTYARVGATNHIEWECLLHCYIFYKILDYNSVRS